MKPLPQQRPGWLILFRVAQGGGVICLLFALMTAVLTGVDAFSVDRAKPFEKIASLQTRYAESGSPKMAADIRALDLLARRSYFRSLFMTKTGAVLSLGFAAFFLLGANFAARMARPLPTGRRIESRSPDGAAIMGVAISAVVLMLAMAVMLFDGKVKIVNPPVSTAPVSSREPKSIVSESKSPPSIDEVAENWPGFRGAWGHAAATGKAPETWDEKNIIWRIEPPLPGNGSPVLWNNDIFLTGADAAIREVYCYDSVTGVLRWKTSLPASRRPPPEVFEDTGYAAPTPTTDGNAVYAAFSNGDIAAVNFDGRILWTKNLGEATNIYGYASSPVVHDGVLVVQFDNEGKADIIGFDTANGEELWRTARAVESSWASPTLVAAAKGNGMAAVLNAMPYVAAYAVADGRELWRTEGMTGEVAPSPGYADDVVVAVNVGAVMQGLRADDGAEIWRIDDGDFPDVSSPLVADGMIIIGDSAGMLSCYAAADGAMLWSHEFDDGFYSSPVTADGKIYITDLAGMVRVFKLSSKFEPLAEWPLNERVVATPALADGAVYLRGEKTLFKIGDYHESP